jgi:DNA (cytosine-5)-methyltransferase 1
MADQGEAAVHTVAMQTGGEYDRYSVEEGAVVHELRVGQLSLRARVPTSELPIDPKGAWWAAYLAGETAEPVEPIGGSLRTVDLYCGPGGLANGVRQLCNELGTRVVSEFIADQDEEATIVHAANHHGHLRSSTSIRKLIDYNIAHGASGARFIYQPELLDEELARAVAGVDLVLAGPPCQGHSNLNNSTRRSDPRNSLYLTVPAFAVAVKAKMCIVENVPAVLNDHDNVVETARDLFESEGYHVTMCVLSAAELGWPQTRKRHFLVARRDVPPVPLHKVASILKDQPRSLWWAIGDLEDDPGDDLLGQVTELSAENKARVDWLFDNDKHELDLNERPKSHRGGTTYTAVYGRLKKDDPAPTITTGFMSPGRGRFTHPTRRRALTAREAARLQGFPDSYVFVPEPARPPSRKLLSKWIGDAVPMPLGYAAALSVLAAGAWSESP